jgi:hypothetical protein
MAALVYFGIAVILLEGPTVAIESEDLLVVLLTAFEQLEDFIVVVFGNLAIDISIFFVVHVVAHIAN